MTKVKEKSETRTRLIEYSVLARKMKKEALDKVLTAQEIDFWTYRGINDIIKNDIYFLDKVDLKTFNQWRKEGATIKKGSKGYALWGQPLKATAKEKVERNGKEEDEESQYEYWPICILFSSEQVITPEAKARPAEAPRKATEAEENEVLTLDEVL
jgi:hypothetical protein